MFCKIYTPHIALKEYINNFMVYDLSTDLTIPQPVHPVPPLPENYIYIYIYDSPEVIFPNLNIKEKLPLGIVIGQQTHLIQLKMPVHNVCVRVAFQPGGLFRLLGIPLNKYFLNMAIDCNELFKNDINIIREQLQEVSELEKMAPIVENYFLKKLAYLKSKLPIDRVLPIIIAKNGLMTIEEIAHDACVSFRQLERQFHQRVGVSPKFFLRLIRFANAWMLKEHKPTASWAYIAYHCGYFDQMHLIKDFKEFAGVSPSLIETELIQSAHFQKTGLEFPSV